MQIDLNPTAYSVRNCAQFMRSRERHGNLSNMTGGFPIAVNGITFQSPEGLYQALKYPLHPNVQRQIAAQPSGMQAKRTAYASKATILKDWDTHRVEAMVLTTALKLSQYPVTFTLALMETASLPIVERSHRDGFWGAVPNGQTLRGVNALGKVLTGTRGPVETLPGKRGERRPGHDSRPAGRAVHSKLPAGPPQPAHWVTRTRSQT